MFSSFKMSFYNFNENPLKFMNNDPNVMSDWLKLVAILFSFGSFSAASRIIIFKCRWSMLGHQHNFSRKQRCTPAFIGTITTKIILTPAGFFLLEKSSMDAPQVPNNRCTNIGPKWLWSLVTSSNLIRQQPSWRPRCLLMSPSLGFSHSLLFATSKSC